MSIKRKNKSLIILTIFLILIYSKSSLAVLRVETPIELNYTYIEILPPDNIYEDFVNKPEKWSNVFSNPKYLSSLLGKTVTTDYESFSSISVPEIASFFNASINLNTPEYAYSYIKVPNENYESLVNVYKALGFEVRNVTFLTPELNESVNSMSLPYTYSGSELTGAGVRVAILDTGLDDTHSDFSGRLKFWADVTGEGYTSYTDYIGHGTHVASIAAGSGSSSSGKYRGVAPGADLYIWKVSDASGASLGWIATAINQAINQNVNVISMSFGLPATAAICNNQVTGDYGDIFNAIQNALNHGIAVIMSNGNNGPNGVVDYPGCINGVIAVGSTAKKDYPSNTYNPLIYYDSLIPYRNKLNINANSEIVGQFTQNTGAIVTNLNEINNFLLNSETSVHFVLQPSSWPANINVNLESEHKDRACYSAADVWWDPGQRNNSDEFWNLASQTFNSGPYVGVEMRVKSHQDEGGWMCCPGDSEPWYRTWTNTFSCSGTPKACNDFDLNKDGCLNQLGCSWCGCKKGGPIYSWCEDISKALCEYPPPGMPGGTWLGCEGTSKNCDDGERINWPYNCGTSDTTGCTGSWSLDSISSVTIFQKNTLGTKDFVSFFSSRGPAPNDVIKPDVTAPGEFICAAKSSEIDTGKGGFGGLNICDNNKYTAYSGTSMATPHVSGTVALMFQAYPTASVCDIRKALLEGAEPAGYGTNVEGYGRVNGKKTIDDILTIKDSGKETCENYDGGYPDNAAVPKYALPCQTPIFQNYNSANQMRNYICGAGLCECSVDYDSYINEVSVNGVTSGEVSIGSSSFIVVNISILNTGWKEQDNWYLGVEFWNVSNYNLPWGTRDGKGRINAYYNGKDKTHGCVLNPNPFYGPIGNCPSGVDCSIISEDFYKNGILDIGETINVSCQAPASFYKPTTGKQRIMFWIHERDLGQDATNDGDPDGDGNVGDWWTDALSKSFRPGKDDPIYGGPTDLRVIIKDTTPPVITIQSPKNTTYYTTSIPLTFTVSEPASWCGYSLDGTANKTLSGCANTTLNGLSYSTHNIIIYANDTSGNMGASNRVYFTVKSSGGGGGGGGGGRPPMFWTG